MEYIDAGEQTELYRAKLATASNVDPLAEELGDLRSKSAAYLGGLKDRMCRR